MISLVSLNLPKQMISIGYAYIFGVDKSPKKNLISFQMWISFLRISENQFYRLQSVKFLVKNKLLLRE